MLNEAGRRIVSVRLFESTWLDARGVSVTVHHDSNRVGLRTIVHLWLDDSGPRNGSHKAGTVTVKVLDGDGREGDAAVVEPARVVPADEVAAWLRNVESALMLGYSDARHWGWSAGPLERARKRYSDATRARIRFEEAAA